MYETLQEQFRLIVLEFAISSDSIKVRLDSAIRALLELKDKPMPLDIYKELAEIFERSGVKNGKPNVSKILQEDCSQILLSIYQLHEKFFPSTKNFPSKFLI